MRVVSSESSAQIRWVISLDRFALTLTFRIGMRSPMISYATIYAKKCGQSSAERMPRMTATAPVNSPPPSSFLSLAVTAPLASFKAALRPIAFGVGEMDTSLPSTADRRRSTNPFASSPSSARVAVGRAMESASDSSLCSNPCFSITARSMKACGGGRPNASNASLHSRSSRRARADVLKYRQWSNMAGSINAISLAMQLYERRSAGCRQPLPAYGFAILAKIRSGAVVAGDLLVGTRAFGAGRFPSRYVHENLNAAHILAADGSHRVAHCRELRADEIIQRRFQAQRIRHLRVTESRHVGRGLQIGAEIENVDQCLRMTLRLHVAAHQRPRHQRLPAMHHESRGQRIEWPLVRFDDVRALRAEREQRAAIVQDETISGHGDP